jgi:hypothetical protein
MPGINTLVATINVHLTINVRAAVVVIVVELTQSVRKEGIDT